MHNESPSVPGAQAMNETEIARRQVVRQRVTHLARLLDDLVGIPGTRLRIGLDALIGFIPVAGDLAGLALGLWLLWQAREVRTPWRLRLKMLGNLGVEAVIGLVPLFGDIFDIAWQANQRNRTLLLDWMDAEDRKAVAPPAGSLPWWPLALVALLLLAVFIWQLSP